MKKRKIVILNIAGLSPALIEKSKGAANIKKLIAGSTYRKMDPTFPAVTCSVQASLTSGKPPADHGIVANGYFNPVTMTPEFWRQEDKLVRGPRIWDWMREKDPGNKVAVMFWQNSKYIDADIVVTPAPLHTDEGMVQWCYHKPPGLYDRLCEKLGPFDLRDYWGPMAGLRGSTGTDWIADASLMALEEEDPDMLLAYLPHLDYVSQRVDPGSEQVIRELEAVDALVGKFMAQREEYGPEHMILILVSEYGLVPVSRVVYPNRILREKGLLQVRTIAGKEYIDFELSPAFTVADHQIAHVYCKPGYNEKVKEVLAPAAGIDSIIDREEQRNYEIHHPRSGDLILLGEKDCWFPYYYWLDDEKAPAYARTVDIHNKPGYDPCELFVDPATRSIPLKPELVKGSHGLPAESDEQRAVFICTEDLGTYAPETGFNATHFLNILYRFI
jgi:predicted AlkP superfamily pyrophosphatase or phosphodiesterase